MEQSSPIALYVHWPFCKKKCPYCDFNSHVSERVSEAAFKEAYIKELEYFAERLPSKNLVSIFFGGGTPSLMPADITQSIIEKAKELFPPGQEIEITLEANPTSSEAKKFEAFKAAGVNRLSLGVQALDDISLKFLGREHSAEEALKALDMARNVWDRVTFDLIYARPNQSLKMWEQELAKALSFGTSHLSLYQLTIEKGTPFYSAFKNKEFTLPDETTAANMYEITEALTEDKGLFAYEVSNYAKPGFESQHNLVYWNYGEYLGIGPGAHSRLKLEGEYTALMMWHKPEKWLEEVQRNAQGVQAKEVLDEATMFEEKLMLGLRKTEGLLLEDLSFTPRKKILQEKLAPLREDGLIEKAEDKIIPTLKGRLVLSSLVAYLAEDAS